MQPATTDERQGIVSMSALPRLQDCPGSYALTRELQQTLPQFDPHAADAEPDELRDAGTRIHAILAAYATGNTIAAAPADTDAADQIWEHVQRAVVKFFDLDPEQPDFTGLEFHSEERLWLIDDHGRKLASGAIDLFVLGTRQGQTAALHIDYKTGWIEVKDPRTNGQFAGYRAAICETYDPAAIQTVCITTHHGIQRTPPLPRDWLAAEHAAVLDLIETTTGPQADWMALGLRPSADACRYCPARIACPALRRASALPSRATWIPYPVKAVAALMDSLPSLDHHDLTRLHAAIEATKPLAKALTAELERRLTADPHSVPGFAMEPGTPKRVVDDPAGMCQALISAGAAVPDVLAAVKIGVGDAETIHRRTTGLKGEGAKAAFRSFAEPFVSTKTPEPTPRRITQ